MSGAVGETEFDESVFADDTPPVIEAAKADTKTDDEPKPEPKSPIQETAEKIGWAGKDAWKGDPAEWIDAPDFILKAAGEVLPSMRKSLEESREEVKGLKAAVKTAIQHMSKADERAYNKARADLEAELEQYATAGNAKAVKEVTDDLIALDREAAAKPKAEPDAEAEPAEMVAWRTANPWYGVDEAHSAACDAIGRKAFADGYTGKAQIAEVDRQMRAKFPALFAKPENPNRRLPGAVEGGGSPPRRGGRSFADMPKEHQDMCLDLMKQSKSITKENYAKEYFAEDSK